jgi:hypothetical protein
VHLLSTIVAASPGPDKVSDSECHAETAVARDERRRRPQVRSVLKMPPLPQTAGSICRFRNRVYGDARYRSMSSAPKGDVSFEVLQKREAIIEAVRKALQAKGLTLYAVAALSRARYPEEKAYHIRRNFYFQLRTGWSPTVQQVALLSQLTQTSLWDWLRLFEFSLGNIPRLQAVLGRPRTGLIENAFVDQSAVMPSLRYRQPGTPLLPVAPLSQFLEFSGSQPVGSFVVDSSGDFIYAKIGYEDTFAYPELLPGSIVRANRRLVDSSVSAALGARSDCFFLVEHDRGLSCGQLQFRGWDRIALLTSDLLQDALDLRLGHNARILGVIDLEFRFPSNPPKQQFISSRPEEPSAPLRNRMDRKRIGVLIEKARLRAGLSFRAASKLSREISRILRDRRYIASPGTLSDYEAVDRLPRQIHKLFTVATLYCLSFGELLRAAGIQVDITNASLKKTIPVSESPAFARALFGHNNGEEFFENLRKRFGELPVFLAGALPALSGLSHISMRDVFWYSDEIKSPHPALRGAFCLLVNRRKKMPRMPPHTPLVSQSLYLFRDRAGTYLAANGTIGSGHLILYTYPRGTAENRPVRRQIDVDIVGQIVGIVRFLFRPFG